MFSPQQNQMFKCNARVTFRNRIITIHISITDSYLFEEGARVKRDVILK